VPYRYYDLTLTQDGMTYRFCPAHVKPPPVGGGGGHPGLASMAHRATQCP